MKIVEKLISEIQEYANNPRRNDDAVYFVANSIREFGFRAPIIIDSTNTIIAGHTRLKAAKSLDLKTVPCVVADDLTEEQIKAFRIIDNKVAEAAEWDLELLENELSKLNLDMSLFGFMDTGVSDFEIPEDIFAEDGGKEYTCRCCGETFIVKGGVAYEHSGN